MKPWVEHDRTGAESLGLPVVFAAIGFAKRRIAAAAIGFANLRRSAPGVDGPDVNGPNEWW